MYLSASVPKFTHTRFQPMPKFDVLVGVKSDLPDSVLLDIQAVGAQKEVMPWPRQHRADGRASSDTPRNDSRLYFSDSSAERCTASSDSRFTARPDASQAIELRYKVSFEGFDRPGTHKFILRAVDHGVVGWADTIYVNFRVRHRLELAWEFGLLWIHCDESSSPGFGGLRTTYTYRMGLRARLVSLLMAEFLGGGFVGGDAGAMDITSDHFRLSCLAETGHWKAMSLLTSVNLLAIAPPSDNWIWLAGPGAEILIPLGDLQTLHFTARKYWAVSGPSCDGVSLSLQTNFQLPIDLLF